MLDSGDFLCGKEEKKNVNRRKGISKATKGRESQTLGNMTDT
jgi:hypothetical protein